MAKLNRRKIPAYTPAEGISPVCPSCDAPIEKVYGQQISQGFGKAHVWFCVSCKRSLGVTHRKGFWMGAPRRWDRLVPGSDPGV